MTTTGVSVRRATYEAAGTGEDKLRGWEQTITEWVDTGEKRYERGRGIVGQERKAEMLRAYDCSDLSQREFARREGINFHTFVEWLQRRRRTVGTKRP